MINQKIVIPEVDNYLSKISVSDRIETDIGRIYSINGKEYPSCTTILGVTSDKSGLDNWKLRVGDEEAASILKEAGIRGTSMHNLIENHFSGLYIDTEEKGFPLYKQLIPFLNNIIPVAMEIPLYSDHLKIAGRCDLIGYNKKNDLLTIFDWKTSRKTKQKEWITDYFLQATLYALMAYECIGLEIKDIQIVIGVDNDLPLRYNESVGNFIKPAIRRVRTYYEDCNV